MFAWTRKPHAALLVTVSAALTACTPCVCIDWPAAPAPSSLVQLLTYTRPPRPGALDALKPQEITRVPGPDVGLRAQTHTRQPPRLRVLVHIASEPSPITILHADPVNKRCSHLTCCSRQQHWSWLESRWSYRVA
ncbi:hypothetical protein F4801DRAFT_60915 [Xylaria longipes]|nr:hypothetical protein F4801DRAFT_60915 [Xylaria longipes]